MIRIIRIHWLKLCIRYQAVEIESMERLTAWRKFKKRNLEARLRSTYRE